MVVHHAEEVIKSADVALKLLKEGNARHVESKKLELISYDKLKATLSKGQHPFAVVVCCSDSRVSPEIFFDQDLGDIFVIRNAGNVVDQTTLGSIEYAVEHLSTPLIVVCGHSHCGAVTAAYEGGDLPKNIKSITDRIQPAKDMGGDLEQVANQNVDIMVDEVEKDEMVQEFGTKVIGAYYDIDTGVVIWH